MLNGTRQAFYTSVASLARDTRVSPKALARWQQQRSPAHDAAHRRGRAGCAYAQLHGWRFISGFFWHLEPDEEDQVLALAQEVGAKGMPQDGAGDGRTEGDVPGEGAEDVVDLACRQPAAAPVQQDDEDQRWVRHRIPLRPEQGELSAGERPAPLITRTPVRSFHA